MNITTPNCAHYKVFQLKHRYKYSTMLILSRTLVRCTENRGLNKLSVFMKICARTTTHNFVRIEIATPDYAYYRIARSKLRYGYSMTLILRKT